jgi:hypothetical protein
MTHVASPSDELMRARGLALSASDQLDNAHCDPCQKKSGECKRSGFEGAVLA